MRNIFYTVLLAGHILMCNARREHPCEPTVKFESCLKTETQRNPMWRLHETSYSFIHLLVTPSCNNSVITIQWILLDKDTGRVAKNMKEYSNKYIIPLSPHSLPPKSYILIARVTEKAFMLQGTTVDKECWIRISKKIPEMQHLAPRYNNTESYVVKPDTNTENTGWRHCSNPRMRIIVSGTIKKDQFTFFSTRKYLDAWTLQRTWWVLPTTTWSWSWSKRLEDYTTKEKCHWRYTSDCTSSCTSESWSRMVSITSSMPNHTGRIGWPQMKPNYKPTERQIYFQTKIKNLTEDYEIIKPKFDWNTEYMFHICETLDTYVNGCANRSKINMCPNYAEYVKCENAAVWLANTATQFTFKCKTEKEILPHLVYGAIMKRYFTSKAQDYLVVACSKTMSGVQFRLPISPPKKHSINLMPMDYETFIQFDDKWWESVDVLSYALDEGNTKFERLKVLQRMRDEGHKLEKFEGLVTGGKIGEAVQSAYLLLSELAILDVADIDISRFQTELLTHFAAGKWTWEGIDMIIGLLSRFDMEGFSKEVEHSKFKSEVLMNVINQMKDFIIEHESPLTIQTRMEGDFFPELYRELSLLFDSNFVKPFTFVVEITTSVYIHIAKAESYKDYDEEMDKAIEEEYIKFSNQGLTAIATLPYARARTHYHKEYALTAKEPSIYSMMYIEKGSSALINATISEQVTIELGDAQNIQEDEDFVCTWTVLNHDMFFWNTVAKDYKVPYFMIHYYMGGTQKIETFNNPPVMRFQLAGELVLPMRTDGMNVPAESEIWTNRMMDRYIRAYRILVEQVNFTFAIFVTKLKPVSRIRVIINRMDKKPRLKDFEDPKSDIIIFDLTQTSFYLTVDVEGYWYIAVLPYKEDVVTSRKKRDDDSKADDRDAMGRKRVSVQFMFQLVMIACPVFHDSEFKFDICTVSPMTRLSTIICVCSEIGIPLTATISALPYKTYGILDIPVKLYIVVEYCIIIATIIAVFLFCLFLVISPYRCKPLELIVFAADNQKGHRYGYMLKVKTADFVKCGTTGYIGVQLYGSSAESLKHILNYPDPDHFFFKNGSVDHFLIATSISLGYLERIEVWSDCSGFAPEWYCESIRVYDLQRDTNYFFNVQKRFGVASELRSHYSVKCSQPKDFRIRTPWVYFNVHFGASHTWNIVDNSQDYLWTYLERLSVILSHMLCTFALTLLLIHPIVLEYKDGIGINNKSDFMFYIWYIFLVTAIVAPANYIFVIIFRGSVKIGRFRGRFGYFPRFIHILAWFLLVVLITICLGYCLICGPFISYTVVYDWLVIVIISLLINVLFCENLFLALHGLIRLSCYCCAPRQKRSRYQFKDIIDDVEHQRKYLYREAGKEGLRPHIGVLYSPLHGELIRKRRKETEDKKAIARTFESMLNLWTFGILLIILIMFYYNTSASDLDKHLEDIFIYARFGNLTLRGVYDVYSFADLYEYMNDTLVNFFTPSVWYQPYRVNDPGLIIDMSSKFLGNVRIRQKRVVRREACIAKLFVEKHFESVKNCYPTLHDDYLMINSSYNKKLKHNNSFWFYHTSEYWNDYIGVAQRYDGNGYTLEMGKTRKNIYYRLGLLKDNTWLDEQTKVIFIEFFLYNAYTNLFSDVKLVWERESGFLFPTYRIYTVKLINVSEWQDKVYIIILMLFILVSIRLVVLTIYYTLKMRTSLFKDAYYVVLVIMQILNVCGIVYIMQKQFAMDKLLDGLKNKDRNKYFPYNHVIHLHQKMELCMAFILFMAILLLLKFMKFFTFTIAIVRALRRAIPTYLLLWLGAFVALACFGTVAQILYGATFIEFAYWLEGPVTFLHMFMKTVDWTLWHKLWMHEGIVVWYTYVSAVIVLAVLRIFFFVVGIWSVYEAKMQVSGEKYRYTLNKYVEDTLGSLQLTIFRRFRFLRRKKVRGGQDDEVEMITPKTNRYRYKDPLICSEDTMMHARVVSWAVLRNQYERGKNDQANAEDIYLMKEIAKLSRKDKSVEIYPRRLYLATRIPNEKRTKTAIVPDDRLDTMAYVARLIVTDPEKVPEEKDKEEGEDEGDAKEKKPTKKHVRIQVDYKSIMKSQNAQLGHIRIVLASADAMIDDLAGLLFADGKLRQRSFDKLCCKKD